MTREDTHVGEDGTEIAKHKHWRGSWQDFGWNGAPVLVFIECVTV